MMRMPALSVPLKLFCTSATRAFSLACVRRGIGLSAHRRGRMPMPTKPPSQGQYPAPAHSPRPVPQPKMMPFSGVPNANLHAKLVGTTWRRCGDPPCRPGGIITFLGAVALPLFGLNTARYRARQAPNVWCSSPDWLCR